jgi:hypothetical protein
VLPPAALYQCHCDSDPNVVATASTCHVIGDPPAVEVYPLRHGWQGDAGSHPHTQHRRGLPRHPQGGARARITDELRQGVEMKSTRGNNEPVPKTTMEFGDGRREARGVRTRPVRPQRANYG